ncbi:MAG TPA: hypothetical protein VFY06_04690 [Verrucomicrobiae bacterium]|nr:hypothetical protein [Verrucomicrobiae bacterium]
MKTNKKTLLALAGLLALGTTALVAQPQNNNDGPPPGGNFGGPGGPAMRGQRPPPPAIVAALDANHDGVIDETEIANASAALKSLDKNGDGKLTPDEFMGPRPRRGGPGFGPGGQRRGPGGPGRGPGGNPGAYGNHLPPGPPPGGDGGNNLPPGPPPDDN